MIITCPSCATRYPVDASAFPASGRKVRCAKCGENWHQSAPSDLPHKIDLDAPAEKAPASAQAESFPSRSPADGPIFNRSKSQPADTEYSSASGDGESQDGDDVDIVFDAPPASAAAPPATGGKLRVYLNNVASNRRGRVLNVVGWVVLLAFVGASVYAITNFRSQIASFWPATAKLYEAAGQPVNLQGIEFHNVVYERQNENGLPILAVRGSVVNITGDTRILPRLRVSLSDAQDQELYHWTFALPEKQLGPSSSASFTTRLSSPPIEARSIEVRFVVKGDETHTADAETLRPASEDAPTNH